MLVLPETLEVKAFWNGKWYRQGARFSPELVEDCQKTVGGEAKAKDLLAGAFMVCVETITQCCKYKEARDALDSCGREVSH